MPNIELQNREAHLADAYEIEISRITTNPEQPRQEFDEDSLQELTDDVQRNGILLPLIVTPQDDGTYTLISGERRLRAAKQVGLARVPVLIKENLTHQDIRRIALAENTHRKNLSLLEEAKAFKAMQEDGLSLRQIAKEVNKSASYVLKRLRLLDIDQESLREYLSGKRNLQELIEGDPARQRKGPQRGRPPLVLKPIRPVQTFHSFIQQIDPQKITPKQRGILKQTIQSLLVDLQTLEQNLDTGSES